MEEKENEDINKVIYRVGDVSSLVDIDPYVLRYWEKMFPQLQPQKDETGQRVYTKADIDIVLKIKKLLYEDRYTIAGAKKKLSEESDLKTIVSKKQFLEVLRNIKNTLKDVSAILEK